MTDQNGVSEQNNPFLEGYARPQPAEPEAVQEAFPEVEGKARATCLGGALRILVGVGLLVEAYYLQPSRDFWTAVLVACGILLIFGKR